MTEHTSPARRRAGACRAALSIAATVALTACGFPTEIPQVDQRWIVPPLTSNIALGSLLPAGVRITPDSSRFVIAVDTVSVSRALSADCPDCAAANGATVPKPAFTAQLSASAPLPAELASATLAGGTVTLSLRNGYNFDPLRPGASARGYVVTTVTNGAAVIGRDSVDGATTVLPAGTFLRRSIPLSGTITGAAPVTITIRVNSPAGDPVVMDASRTIGIIGATAGVQAPNAAIVVDNRQVASSSTLALDDIDASIVNHVTAGALLLDVDNPFAIAGAITVTFSALGVQPVTKGVALAPGLTHPGIALTQDELRSLLGRQVRVSFSGPVSGTGGPITVSPRQAVVVNSRLDVTLHTGG